MACVSGYPVFINEPWLKDWPEYIIFDMGSHLLDVARFLFGEAERLYCEVDRIHADVKGEDVATLMLRMGGRTTVTVELGFAERPTIPGPCPTTWIVMPASFRVMPICCEPCGAMVR
jgi:predicted dehydrogenase